MKRIILLSIMLSLAGVFDLAAQDAITLTWTWQEEESYKTLHIGATTGKELTVNWGDGTIETKTYYYSESNSGVYLNHSYITQGEYTVTIVASTADCRFIHFYCNVPEHICPQISSLSLTGCSDLQFLLCGNSPLTNLDLSGCSKLEILTCYNNQLRELDLTGYPKLTSLNCQSNQLTELDLSGKSDLRFLYCGGNQLTNLDLTDCLNLQYLSCEFNQLTRLILSGYLKLRVLNCCNNQLQLSDLFAANLLMDSIYGNKPLLGTQNLQPQTVIVGAELFSEQSVFDGVFTKYSVTQNGNPASESDYTVIDGKLTFNTVGNYTVTMTNEAILSHSNYPAQVIVEIMVEKSTGIAETLHATSLQVFPNPTSGELRITNQESEIGNIEIFDATGKSVFKKQLSIINHQLSIDISHLPAGIYFLHVDEQTVKVVKK